MNNLLQIRKPHNALSPNICAIFLRMKKPIVSFFLHCPIAREMWLRLNLTECHHPNKRLYLRSHLDFPDTIEQRESSGAGVCVRWEWKDLNRKNLGLLQKSTPNCHILRRNCGSQELEQEQGEPKYTSQQDLLTKKAKNHIP